MATISACMIVKNEEQIIERCLKCIQPIVDEIIIVDTGSVDQTKEIARQYTDKIYDFTWVNDFAKARNFSFSKASMDYIYVADADEIIDEVNQARFLTLKEHILPEIEVVQMYYANQLEFNTTYNYDKEYRPKLYKRLREFTWIDPIHEGVRLEPVIYDSEIEIIHKPLSNHASRDFHTFLKVINRGEILSDKLIGMYARELMIAGIEQDFIDAYNYFVSLLENRAMEEELLKKCQCIVARGARVKGDENEFFKTCLKNVALEKASSEICCELGEYYLHLKDAKEASIWFYNAAYETNAELNAEYQGKKPLLGLSQCYQMLGDEVQAKEYESLAANWKIE